MATHLSTEELLLLSDGELETARAAHLDECAECRAALGAVLGQMTTLTSVLRSEVPAESVEAQAASQARLEAALYGEKLNGHLSPEELLLHCDDELSLFKAEHLERCIDCHDEYLRMQAALSEVEYEMRELMPAEPAERRAAALAALRARLEPVSPKVVEFPAPVRRWNAYAAAAAAAFAAFGGLWYSQQTATVAPSETLAVVEQIVEQPAPAVSLPAETAPVVEVAQAPVDTSSPAPTERFELSSEPAVVAPRRMALDAGAPAVTVQPRMIASGLRFEPPTVEPIRETAAPAETVVAAAQRPAEVLSFGDRPLGGLVRTALLEHYSDAARRSFVSPTPELLEGEIARYVNELYRSQSELIKNVYELNRMFAESDAAGDRKSFRKLADARLDEAERHERRVYDHLSETLPRKYWASRGAGDQLETQSAQAEAQALLRDALQLEVTLTELLNRPAATVDVADPTSSGALLDRIQTRLRNLREHLEQL